MENKTSRRDLLITSLKGALSISTAALILPLLSCKKSPPSKNNPSINEKNDAPANCPEQKLSEQEKSVRSSLQYVDQSPFAQKRCDNCKVYTLPVGGALCGGCKIVPGPIHPKGYCSAWIARI